MLWLWGLAAAHASPTVDASLVAGVVTADLGSVGPAVGAQVELRWRTVGLASRLDLPVPGLHETVRAYTSDPTEKVALYGGLGLGLYPTVYRRPMVTPAAEVGLRAPLAGALSLQLGLLADGVTNRDSDLHVLLTPSFGATWSF